MNNNFKIDLAGVNEKHAKDFTIDRPKGAEFYIFVHFEVAVKTRINNKEDIFPQGSFLLFQPGFPHWYKGYNEALCDNWLHIYGKNTEAIYKNCGLPVNQVVRAEQTGFIREYIKKLKNELSILDNFTQRSNQIIFEKMCIDASRHIKHRKLMKADKSKARHLEVFDNIRHQIRDDFANKWTIEKMSEMANMSESRFAVLYKEFYNISPLNDLIDTRLRYAKYLLSNTALSVKQIASECGFENVYYFGRLFKKRIGTTPGKYYLSIGDTENACK
ncbi:MAG: helix-turn-helix transcriptional regulator [Sedimentisphaeraceae bacterium JB056]